MDRNKEKLKKLQKASQNTNILIIELLRQIDLEMDSSMVLIEVDGKTCWRAGAIDKEGFETTIKSIFGEKSDKDEKSIYKILFLTLNQLSENGQEDLLAKFLKEFKKSVVTMRQDELNVLKSEINRLKEIVK